MLPTANLRHPLTIMILTLGLGLSSFQISASNMPTAEPTGHSIYFTINESQRIDNNVASVTFHIINQAPNAELVMEQINKKMQVAHTALKDLPDLELQTSQYQVNPSYNKEQVITHWQGQQSLTIITENQAGLPKLLETLQPHLSYQSMRFYVSDSAQKNAKDQLLNKALRTYQERAKQIANGFDAQKYQLVETRIDLPGLATPYAENYLRSARLNVMSDSVAPVVEAGKSEVSVQVSGKIVLPH